MRWIVATYVLAWAAVSQAGIDGQWTTFDDRTHQERATVEIVGDGRTFTGRIVALHTAPGEDPEPRCTNCSGPDRDQPVLGLEIMHVTAASDGRTYEGRILDPDEGLRYRCIVTPDADGKELSIRGYVGIPALGRTVVWSRAQ